MSFRLPKELQDWLNLLLGLWILISPWVLGFIQDAAAAETATGIGFLIVAAEVFTFSRLRPLEEWINLGLGAWLALSPWLLNISSAAARIDFIGSGLAVCLLAVYELADSWRNPATHH